MVVGCAVAGCTNSQRKKGQLFHSFPTKNKPICKVWADRCRRKDKFNTKNSTICSSHFNEDDYERDLRNELLGIPVRKRLKPGAVPSVFSFTKNKEPQESAREVRSKVRERKMIVKSLLDQDSLGHEKNDTISAEMEIVASTQQPCTQPNDVDNVNNDVDNINNNDVRPLTPGNHNISDSVELQQLRNEVMQQRILIESQQEIINRQRKIIISLSKPKSTPTPKQKTKNIGTAASTVLSPAQRLKLLEPKIGSIGIRKVYCANPDSVKCEPESLQNGPKSAKIT